MSDIWHYKSIIEGKSYLIRVKYGSYTYNAALLDERGCIAKDSQGKPIKCSNTGGEELAARSLLMKAFKTCWNYTIEEVI